MGCACSRSYPPRSVPWAVQETLLHCGYSRLKVLQINKALYPVSPPTDDCLSQVQLEALSVALAVELPVELLQIGSLDSRIKRKRLYFALVLMSEDDEDSKTAALYPFLGTDKRNWVRFLEWREEFLLRLVRKAVNLHYVDEDDAKTALSERIPKGNSSLLAACERLWTAASMKEQLIDQHLCNFHLSSLSSSK